MDEVYVFPGIKDDVMGISDLQRAIKDWRIRTGVHIKFVYVSGPYSKGNINQNVRMAIYTGDELARRGYVPFIPHLSHLWDLVSAHDCQFWLEQDLQWLERCDCIFRLPGESAGADLEVSRALELGLPVFYSWAELERYTNDDPHP